MDVKWFFAIIIVLVTFAIIAANYFMASYIALQSQQNYDRQINSSQTNFNRSIFIHDSLFSNITDLKQKLDPIIATVKNATQSEIDRQIHYNQTSEDFDKIKQVLQIKLQDHKTLNQVNATVNEIKDILLGTSPIVPITCTNGTIAEEEQTTNSLPHNQC